MKLLRDQILATTNTDLHGDRIPPERLREIFEQLPDPWLLANQHDLALPPMARAIGKRFVQLPDGEWSIQADVEVFDEAAFAGKTGYSIAYLRNVLSVNPDRPGDVEIIFNPRVFPEREIGELVSLSTQAVQVDARELIQKGLEATIILVLKFGSAAFATGLLAKAGADSWDALRAGLKSLAAKRSTDTGEEVVTHLQFAVDGPANEVEVLIEVRVSDYPLLEDDLPLVESALEQVQHFAAEAEIRKVALRFSRDPSRWEVCYFERHDGEVVAPGPNAA